MDQDFACSFCGTALPGVRHLIKGRNIEGVKVYICDDCVETCQAVIEEKVHAKEASDIKKSTKDKLTPEKIVDYLNQYVVGQTEAKKLLAVAVYNHYKRIGKKVDVELQKSNVLLVGPTGSGKTHVVKHLAKLLEVPFAQADATTITEAGYVGDDVDMVLASLVVAADGDIARAEKGIIYIDEIDKIASTGGNGRDVKGEGVQQSLLKMLEGSVMQVNPQGGKKNPQGPIAEIDTTNILFICGGAFGELTDSQNIKRRSLGIKSADKDKEEKRQVKPKELIKFGMIPEFMGRLPILAQLQLLEPEDLIKILQDPKDSLVKQYRALFALDGVDVTFTPEFLKGVAAKAFDDGTGARGLRSIMEKSLVDHMYTIPSRRLKKLTIGPKDVTALKELG